MNSSEVDELLVRLSTHTRLLVASDFDGTVSEFAESPEAAQLDPRARVALRILSELPNTYVAIISGRSLASLASRFEKLEKVRLVGSHGHEFDIHQVAPLTESQSALLAAAKTLVAAAAERCPGTRTETKPHGVAFHFRGIQPTPVAAVDALRNDLSSLGGGTVRDGNAVLEYCAVATHKGEALIRIRDQIAPTITLFIGDDLTDEDGFKALDKADVSIKIGIGETGAQFCLGSVDAATSFLARLAERRSEWMNTEPSTPINEHLFLSDLRTAALVESSGKLSWLCTPRIDGSPLFGSLVGGPGAGYFSVTSAGEPRQEYLDGALIGKISRGRVVITDFFDCSAGRPYQRAGRSDFIRLIEGTGEVFVEFAPKFNFGRTPTRLVETASGLRVSCGQPRVVLVSPGWQWEIVREGQHDVARARRGLHNEQAQLILLLGTASDSMPARPVKEILVDSRRFWEGWLSSLRVPSAYAALVRRSALVLRGLCYGPSGAIAAAATTSLPETLGGGRNWDYRYCWPRDASWSGSALVRIGAPGPAIRFLDWILGIVLDSDPDHFLAPLYTVTARTAPGEAEVPDAFGYRGSRPVRIGNLAADQLQLDALGPIAELMWNLAREGISLTPEHLQLAERLVGLVQLRWNDPDSGIWEVRGAERHFVYSKLMCWYTVTCCSEISKYLGTQRDDWVELAAAIRHQIETRGFNEDLQSYVAAYDLNDADAALAWIVLSGFHPPDHPRSKGTIRYIIERLMHEDSVYRYHFDDSLHGREGEFLICRCWLIEALVKMGEAKEARRMFERIITASGPLGLLSEQWDPQRNIPLGNYPQAYSHLGLINAACALESVSSGDSVFGI